ncbi:hypothetical protein CEXT_431291 [Caerostris extrusa]|uniref:Uncharacterized protein n=1 Tax=Caerostris extrusa TaxID=172846 RepID=A0AAV4XHG8_CAEEX|nr:hypothetical protein CEXT_431291 [Caerostris extrusa]
MRVLFKPPESLTYPHFFENVCTMINKRVLLQKEQCVLLPANPVRFIKLTAKDVTGKKEKDKEQCVLLPANPVRFTKFTPKDATAKKKKKKKKTTSCVLN